ncbi:MAG: MFS transporter [Gammaproteobacteria bacterium]|nr:MFS transporter [Gammaproteobacteria bacterium]MYK81910.1 MFS transporter [Gammaproteobacteria bacterium]
MFVRPILRASFVASGAGSGVISNGLSYFLLIYYSQVLGLDPALAGLAMLILLVFDAVSDPVVGRWSDRLKHRLGRRHPFLFAAIVPTALAYYLLWNPPTLSQTGLFIYLLAVALVLRTALTMHAVPFNALLPEVTTDYDQRTRLLNDAYSGSWFFGTIMAVAMYAYWLADLPSEPPGSGVLRAEGYVQAGLVTGVLVLFFLAFAAFATRSIIPQLAPPPHRSDSFVEMWREGAATLNDRNFLAMVASGLMNAAAWGTSMALWAYMQPYFWGFSTSETSIILASQLLSAALAFTLTPRLAAGREKKPVFIALLLLAIAANTGPVFLELIGVFPDMGSPVRFHILVALGVVQVLLIVMSSAIGASMIADIVEARELVTGRREEGLLFAVLSFTGKVATGIGAWVAGMLLSLIRFPQDSAATAVPPDTVARLGWVYGPTLAALYGVSILALRYYRLDRAQHQSNLEMLAHSQLSESKP